MGENMEEKCLILSLGKRSGRLRFFSSTFASFGFGGLGGWRGRGGSRPRVRRRMVIVVWPEIRIGQTK